MISLDSVRDRWVALQHSDVVRATADACRQQVASVVYLEPRSADYSPEPYRQQKLGRSPRRRLSEPAERMTRVGLDASGRAVIAESVQGSKASPRELMVWSEGRVEMLEVRQTRVLELRVLDLDGATMVSCRGDLCPDGRPLVTVTRYRYGDDALLVSAVSVTESREDAWHWRISRYTHEAGVLGRIERIPPTPGQSVVEGEDYEGALAAAVAAAAGQPSRVTWDGRLLAPEDPPSAGEVDLAESLAATVHAAAMSMRTRLGALAFVVVDTGRLEARDPSSPTATVVDATLRERARSAAERVEDVIELAARAERFELVDAAPAELLRRLRQVSQHGGLGPDFARDLAVELNARDWGAIDGAFLVLVRDRRGDAPTRAAVGSERVDALYATLEPTDRAGDVQLTRREEVAALLASEGLPEPGASTLVADASWAIVLEPGGSGQSRVGGRPVIAGEWPLTRDGRKLAHLATIALSELPAVEGREVLPDDGHLSFFADLDDHAALLDPVEPGSHNADRATVIYTASDANAVEPAGPALAEQRVHPQGRLQLPHVGSADASRRYGLDVLAEHQLARIARQVNGGVAHQLLGFPAAIQGDPRTPGQVSLLHLAHDAQLGFDILDAGTIQFIGDHDDVQALRWHRITAWTATG